MCASVASSEGRSATATICGELLVGARELDGSAGSGREAMVRTVGGR